MIKIDSLKKAVYFLLQNTFSLSFSESFKYNGIIKWQRLVRKCEDAFSDLSITEMLLKFERRGGLYGKEKKHGENSASL